MQEATDTCAHCGGPKAVRNPSGACDHLYWPDCLSYEGRVANGFEPTRDQITERQQQVIDLLMKAVEPFSGVVTYEHLCRVREAKVEALRILGE